MAEKFLQLVASGNLAHMGGTHKISSRRIFRTREAAEEHIPAFRSRVTTSLGPLDLWVLEDDEQLEIRIVELELE